jgi:hypothetical protein
MRTPVVQHVHKDLIRYKAEFGASPVSSSSSCMGQFTLWAAEQELPAVNANLTDAVKDLHSYYA